MVCVRAGCPLGGHAADPGCCSSSRSSAKVSILHLPEQGDRPGAGKWVCSPSAVSTATVVEQPSMLSLPWN